MKKQTRERTKEGTKEPNNTRNRHYRGNYVLIHNGLLYVMQQKLVLERSSGNICVQWLTQKSSFRFSLRRKGTTLWKVARKITGIFIYYLEFCTHLVSNYRLSICIMSWMSLQCNAHFRSVGNVYPSREYFPSVMNLLLLGKGITSKWAYRASLLMKEKKKTCGSLLSYTVSNSVSSPI